MTIFKIPKSANPGTPGVASTSAETFSDFRLRPGNQLTPRPNQNNLENFDKKESSGNPPKPLYYPTKFNPKNPKIGLGATIISTPNIAF